MDSVKLHASTLAWRIAWGVGLLLAVWPGDVLGAPPSRGVVPLPVQTPSSHTFEPGQSAGLFVGVRWFRKGAGFPEVPFAVDDAVDLAHRFSIGLPLIDPHRILLALSGAPVKVETKQRLADLTRAGARVTEATTVGSLRESLARQVAVAGKDGLLVVSFATHGFTARDVQYLMVADSRLSAVDSTALKASEVFSAVGRSRAVRRLVLVDACRERLSGSVRGAALDPRSAMSRALAEAMARSQGQAILSAARAGGYAYDDYERRNGVFTAAVLEALRCKAKTDEAGFVTAGTLATYVNDQVVAWVEKNRGTGLSAEDGIERSLGVLGPDLPLIRCLECPVAAQPESAEVKDSLLEVRSQDRRLLWTHRFSGNVAKALVADLNGDGSREVVAGVNSGGEDTGKVQAFDCKGDSFWSVDTTAPFNYNGAHSDRLAVTQLAVADLFGSGGRQIVALSIDAQAFYQSRLCIFDGDGRLLSSYWHPGHLHKIAVGSERPGDPARIIVEGVNNDLSTHLPGTGYATVVFMLDPRNVQGEAPPYLGASGKGTELWYGYLLPKGMETSRLDILDRDHDGRNEISLWSTKSQILYLGLDGHYLGQALGIGNAGSIEYRLLKK